MKNAITEARPANFENAVSQLKELADHGYVEDANYEFINLKPETPHTPIWRCVCLVRGWDSTDGYAASKPDAKKVATLKMLFNVTAY